MHQSGKKDDQLALDHFTSWVNVGVLQYLSVSQPCVRRIIPITSSIWPIEKYIGLKIGETRDFGCLIIFPYLLVQHSKLNAWFFFFKDTPPNFIGIFQFVPWQLSLPLSLSLSLGLFGNMEQCDQNIEGFAIIYIFKIIINYYMYWCFLRTVDFYGKSLDASKHRTVDQINCKKMELP